MRPCISDSSLARCAERSIERSRPEVLWRLQSYERETCARARTTSRWRSASEAKPIENWFSLAVPRPAD